jgi:hypothetical protein
MVAAGGFIAAHAFAPEPGCCSSSLVIDGELQPRVSSSP